MKIEAITLGNLGLAYVDQGKKWQATRSCDKALNVARKSKSANTLAWTRYKYALVLFKQGKWNKVVPLAEKAAQLFVRLEDKEMVDRTKTLQHDAEGELRKKRSSSFLF